MADPKIKYDIEAAVKGDADAEQLAKALTDVSDVLEGDLKQSAQDAAQALEALNAKQKALSAFGTLKRETQGLSQQLDQAVGVVDRLGNELQDAAGKTQTLSTAERSASAAVAEAQATLQRKRDALKAVREETTGAARRSDEYRATVTGLKDSIKAATEEVKTQQQAQRTAAQAAGQAQNAEAALRKEYDLAIGSAQRLSGELRNKNTALASARESLQSVGVSTTNLAQQERNLQTAVAQVRAEVATLAPAYQAVAAASSQSTQVQAQNQRTLREGMTSISVQLQRIQSIASIAVGGGYFGGLAKDVAATADEFRNLEARIKLATGEGPQFQQSFTGVQQIALRTNSALDETGTLFTRLAKAAEEGGMAATQAQQRALRLTETINQSIQLSGGSAEGAKAAITQLIQGLQSGVLRGEEFNSVMEQAPRLAQALAQGLGVTTGELRKLAEQGALTSEAVMKSLEGQADVIAGEFSKLPPTVGRALQNLSTQWTLYVGAADNGLISSANAAKVINALASNIDLLVNTLTAAGKAWAAIKIAGLVADFARWVTTTTAASAALEANTAATAANVVAQRASAAAQAEGVAAQAASTVATKANTAARAENAKAWGEVGVFTRVASLAQDAATASTARSTAALAENAAGAARAGIVWRGVSALFGPWGIAVAALTPEILGMTRSIGEQTAKMMGWGQRMEEAERKLRALDEAGKIQAENMRRQAAMYEEVRNRSFDLTKQSTGLIAEFDKLKKAGESTADALSKIGKDFDVSNSAGIRAMSAALDKLRADNKITAAEFQSAWAKALDGQDLAKFEAMARVAFGSAAAEAGKLQKQLSDALQQGASEEVVRGLRQRLEGALSAANREAERVAQTMNVLLREAVDRTGLDFTVLQGRIGEASRSAINDLEVVIGGLDKLKAQGVDAGRVLEASFVKALNTADSQKALDDVRARVEQLRNTLGEKVADGLLDQAREKALALSDALEKSKPGINSLREGMTALGLTTDATLKQNAENAREAYDAIRESGIASTRELREAFVKTAEAAIAANKGIAPSWVQAEAAVRGYRVVTDEAGKSSLVLSSSLDRSATSMRGVVGAAGAGAAAVRDLGAAYSDAGAKALAAQGQILAAAAAQRSADVSASSIANKPASATQFAWTRTTIIDYLKQSGLDEMLAERLSAQFTQADGSVSNTASAAQIQWGGKFSTLAEALGKMSEYYRLGAGKSEAAAMLDYERNKGKQPGAPAAPQPLPKPPLDGSGGGSGDGGSGPRVDRIVNVYIGASPTVYSVPTNSSGQANIEQLARAVVTYLEDQKRQAGL